MQSLLEQWTIYVDGSKVGKVTSLVKFWLDLVKCSHRYTLVSVYTYLAGYTLCLCIFIKFCNFIDALYLLYTYMRCIYKLFLALMPNQQCMRRNFRAGGERAKLNWRNSQQLLQVFKLFFKRG